MSFQILRIKPTLPTAATVLLLVICGISAALTANIRQSDPPQSVDPLSCTKCHTDSDLAEKQKIKTGSRDPQFVAKYELMLKRLRSERHYS